MSQTLGCTTDHTGTDLGYMVGLAIAVDQGDQFYTWEGPYQTTLDRLL